jgi:hypothetical protein
MDARKAWLQPLQVGCLVVIAGAVGYGYARQPPPAPTPARLAPPPLDPGFPVVETRPAEAPAAPPTIDALLAEIVKLRKQRQELEVREQALVRQVRDRLRDLGDKLAELGISAADAGNTTTTAPPAQPLPPAAPLPPGSPPAP